jgi:steroid delta-isomerase-like uncharacterized protein
MSTSHAQSPDVQSLVQRYVESVWNRADLAALDALTTPGFTYTLGTQPVRDRKGLADFLATVHTAFPDWRVQIVDIIPGAQSAAIRWQGEVTHAGPFHGIAPTGRRVAVSGINIYHIENGLIIAEWEQMDSLGMLRQMGVFGTSPA